LVRPVAERGKGTGWIVWEPGRSRSRPRASAPADRVAGVAEDIAELAIGHVRADLIARYNKDEAWSGRSDAFTRVSDHVASLIGARAGAAVIPLRG
jgi:hypothetical protein